VIAIPRLLDGEMILTVVHSCLSWGAPAAMSAGVVDLKTFGLNIYLLIGILFVALVAGVVLVILWMVAKQLRWRVARDRALREAQEAKIGPDGRPYPPAGMGLCHGCKKAFDRVYFLPSGEQLCPRCYERHVLSDATALPAAGGTAGHAGPAGRAGRSARLKEPKE